MKTIHTCRHFWYADLHWVQEKLGWVGSEVKTLNMIMADLAYRMTERAYRGCKLAMLSALLDSSNEGLS
jgi:hypothetical protein